MVDMLVCACTAVIEITLALGDNTLNQRAAPSSIKYGLKQLRVTIEIFDNAGVRI